MPDESGIEELREHVRWIQEHPDELWQLLVENGVIDEKGRVLKRIPEGPPWMEKPKRVEKPKRKKRKKPPHSGNGQGD